MMSRGLFYFEDVQLVKFINSGALVENSVTGKDGVLAANLYDPDSVGLEGKSIVVKK
jgi:hypothetical protein